MAVKKFDARSSRHRSSLSDAYCTNRAKYGGTEICMLKHGHLRQQSVEFPCPETHTGFSWAPKGIQIESVVVVWR